MQINYSKGGLFVNKEKLRIFLCGVAVGLVLLLLCGSALAASTTRQLTAIYNNIKIYVDGELISPKDVNGKPTEPFIIEGSTYLPVRAVAEALGKPVDWDGPNQSVYIGTKPQIIPQQPQQSLQPLDIGTAKIAIITNDVTQNEEEYRSAQELVTKYGSDKIIHKTWPVKFPEEKEQMIRLLQQIADDKDVKALIINQAVQWTLAALDELLETRNDIFIALVFPHEDPMDVAKRADLILLWDELNMGLTMAQQTKKLGAKTFVHLSFPRHLSHDLISARYGMIKDSCEKLGIDFVNYVVPDPISDIGIVSARQVMLEEVPKLVAQYGKDTAFFCTNCNLQIPLIKAVVDSGAIYPQPCCPSPLHGFPLALGLISSENGWYSEESVFDKFGSVEKVNAEISRILKAKGVSGRVSNWPAPPSMVSTNAAAEYAFKWIKGEVPKQGIDKAALAQCIKGYAGVNATLRDYDDVDGHFPNWQLFLLDYIIYGE